MKNCGAGAVVRGENDAGHLSRMTRRQLGVAITAAAAAGIAAAQTPQAPARGPEQEDLAKSAREAVTHNAQQLAKYEVPIATEPAFQFRA